MGIQILVLTSKYFLADVCDITVTIVSRYQASDFVPLWLSTPDFSPMQGSDEHIVT